MGHSTLSIGGATYDLFVRLPTLSLESGTKIRIDTLIEACGGGASNTAVGLARLGCTAAFEGVVSSDMWGEKLLQTLKKERVDVRCVTIVDREVSSFSLILSDKAGERIILYEPGTNAHLHDMTFDKEKLSAVDWVYLNHLQEESCSIHNDIVEMLSVPNGPKITWNPGGCQIQQGYSMQENRLLLSATDIFIVNKEEALTFCNTSTAEEAVKILLDAGTKNIVITNGKHGTVASDGQALYRCPAVPNTIVVDTTGAGDAFGTGVTWGILSGMPLPDALKAGSINAASVVGAIGAQTALLTDIDIIDRLQASPLEITAHSL